MRFTNSFYSNYLQTTAGIFEKIKNFPDFLAVIAGYGYDNARIEQGKGFYNEFHNYHHLYLEKRQLALSKSKTLHEMYDNVFLEYSNHIKRLRQELRKDLETKTALGIKGARVRSMAGFYDQATNFYNMALKPEILAKIQGFGFATTTLETGLQHVKEFAAFRMICETIRGECQELVEKRHQAYLKLRDWITAFIASCKVAYTGNLQTLEKFGLFMRNRPKPPEEEEPEIPETSNPPAVPETSTAVIPSTPPATDTVAKKANAAPAVQKKQAIQPA